MAKSKQAKKKNEGKRKPSPKPVKSKNGRMKQKATNKYNSKALESIYGSITRDSKNWGKRTRAMNESAYEGKPYEQGSRKRQRPNYNGNNNNKSKNYNNNRKPPPAKPQFQLRMPPAVPAGQIPWWKKPTAKPSQKKMKLLDEIKVDPKSMSVLDQELEAFSKYVQLSAKEIETRDSIIQTIRSEAKERFGIRESDVKVFGSYAARSVCTFESDVDLVIWGLVEDERQHSWNNSQVQEEVPILKETPPLPQPEEPQPEHPNMKKQHQIRKWKAAIDEFEKQRASEVSENKNDGKTEVKEDSEKKSAAVGGHGGKDDGDTTATVSNSESPSSENDQFEDADEKSATGESHGGGGKDDGDTAATVSNSESPSSENDQFEDADEKLSTTNEILAPDGSKDTSTISVQGPPLFVIDRLGDESSEGQAKAVTKDGSVMSSTKEDAKVAATDGSASEDDTADKLEGLKSRESSSILDTSGEGSEFHGLPLPDAYGDGAYFQEMKDAIENDDEEEEDEQEEALITKPKIRSRSHSLVSLSSATTCSDNQMVNEDGLEVSFVSDSPSRSIIARGPPQKLSDDVRLIVNSKLNQLSKRIRKAGVAASIELRKWARVPILNMKTRYGYECDIGVGGHNGNDTSAYAGSQIAQHPSFAPVVMLLKILLNQHDLDKPFTGGLGSFKLYVLVANHIQQHVAWYGASATPSEILMTFFYRYGDIRSYRNINPSARTDIVRVSAVHCHDGGVVEISQVFQMENCVALFQACWWTLMKALSRPTTTSLLRLIVDARRLRQRRETANSMNSFTHHRQTQSELRGHVSSLVRYSTNHHENRAISKLFKGGAKPFKKKNYRGGRRKSK